MKSGVYHQTRQSHVQTLHACALLLGHFRERIEGVFNAVQNTGRHLERLLRKSVRGFYFQVVAKMASHTLRILLRKRFNIDVLTFRQHTCTLQLETIHIIREVYILRFSGYWLSLCMLVSSGQACTKIKAQHKSTK